MPRASRILSSLVAGATLAGVALLGMPPASAQAQTLGLGRALGAVKPLHVLAPRIAVLDVLPASVDLRRWAVAPGNQGQVSSCVAWAIDYGMLGWYANYTGRTGAPFAPMYTYSQINGGVDEGSLPTDALQLAKTQGNDTRADYTQGDYDWRDKPTTAERANAAHYQIKGWETLFSGANQSDATTAIEHALASNKPVAIEMAVRAGFETMGPAPTAVDNDFSSSILGYHEVLAVGYDANGLIIENSWGTSWADGGFGRISWRVVQHDVWEADTIDGFAAPPTAPPHVVPPSVSVPTLVKLVTPPHARPGAPVSYRVTWTGTRGTTGAITRFDVFTRTGNGALVAVKITSATATSFTLTAVPGRTYQVAVRARAGSSIGTLRYSATIKPPTNR